ncbi:DUF4192 domain-containing protein [Phycicoccus flavus]|uniref:DUF4192 domain-containing protein n=1 Tax=Phycicoccus flavus TaxID=2502783 RepID=UPI000FEBA607|nr:DUF4192 domain-containing protein [Phycicoccus flavus]NHA66806.1 DUF4192 domain-containing protein [Phycicoccus flavus]
MTTPISLRGSGDLVATLPYQLGYHPRRSAVAVGLHGGTVGLVARVDLPPPHAVPAAVEAFLGPFRREGPDGVLLVGYEDDEGEALPFLRAVADAVRAGGARVMDVATVRGGRWYAPFCEGAGCCPPDGVPVPPPHAIPAVAELVALGSAPLADRDAVDRAVAPDPALPRPPAGRGRRPSRRTVVGAWAALLGSVPPGAGPTSTVRDAAWVARVATAAAGLLDVPLRDGLVAWLVPGVLSPDAVDATVRPLLEALPRWGGMGVDDGDPDAEGVDDADGAGGARGASADGDDAGREAQRVTRSDERRLLLALLGQACRAVPDDRPDAAAALCTVTAHVAWSVGEGALARAGLDRALRLAPGYRLAVLLEQLVAQGIRPTGVRAPRTVHRWAG